MPVAQEDVIEVLDAERSLFQAQLSLTQTRGVLFQSLDNLYRAMGRGWDIENATTPLGVTR